MWRKTRSPNARSLCKGMKEKLISYLIIPLVQVLIQTETLVTCGVALVAVLILVMGTIGDQERSLNLKLKQCLITSPLIKIESRLILLFTLMVNCGSILG